MCGGTEKPCGSSVLNKWGWERRGLEEMDFVAEPSFFVLGDIVLWWRWRNFPRSLPGVMVQGCHILAFYTFDLGDLIVVTQQAFDILWCFLELQFNITLLLFGVVLLVSWVCVYLNCQNEGNSQSLVLKGWGWFGSLSVLYVEPCGYLGRVNFWKDGPSIGGLAEWFLSEQAAYSSLQLSLSLALLLSSWSSC